MSLQTENLAMIGLGVLGNQPANSYQSPLADGIHLRWGFLRELGFPWHGFYLFRRPALTGRPLCLSGVIGGLKKGNWPDNKHYTAIGLLSSNTNLILTEDFTPSNQVEFALDGRNYLRFDLPTGELARRVELRIGFRAQQRCLELDKVIRLRPLPDGSLGSSVARQNPLNVQGIIFHVKDSVGALAANTQFDLVNTTSGQLLGLACGYGLTIKLPAPSNAVELLITRTLSPLVLPPTIIEAFDSNNNKVATAKVLSPANQQEVVKLNGQNMTRIEISSIRSTVYLHRVCADNLSVEGVGGGKAEVKVTAFSGTTPVHSVTINGQGGQIVSTILEADELTAIEIGPGPAVLVDLCYVPVAQAATQGWEPLPNFSYPTGLPVTQTDYPCSVANPQTLLATRVHYQLPSGWDGSTFTQMHDQLVELVKDGPSAAPMVDRIFAAPPAQSIPPDPDPPKLNNFYVLDMLLLGSLHPALAQLVGLYWVDQTAAPNVAYDYLIVADHTGVGKRDASKVLKIIQSDGFVELDGYIVFNKRLGAAPPLPAPTGLKTYELPGGTFPNAQGQLPQASNNGGLRWEVGWDDSGALLPDKAVMYLIWRADLGNTAQPTPAGNHNLITKLPPNNPRPLLVTEPRLPNGVAPQRSPDWPPDPLHYIDRNLPDGWYSYQVSGIDLFGRHSPNSAPAQLRLLDRIPPPMPTAVEAYALDPEDPFLKRDGAYKDWYNSLDALVRQTLIGLRVSWRWTKAHQQQAPDTTEFRIYFHPGSDLPSAHDLTQNWQERFHVVSYNQYFYSINPTNRNFPKIGGTDSVSVTAASGAKWWAISSDPTWLTITSASSGNGNGTVTYSVAANPGAARTGTLKIAGHTFITNQRDASSTLPVSPAVSTPEDRVYEIFLPLPSTTIPIGLSLNPTLAEPVVYANIGVSAADDKPHTNDQRTTGSWGNRPGNEGRIGPPAKIYRVLRALPSPPEALLNDERYYASPANYRNHSFFTYRWKPQQFLKLHVFRAMDDGIFKADWAQRPRTKKLDESQLDLFPPGWNKATREKIADELNMPDSFVGLTNGTEQAMAYYRQLSDSALRVLAGLPSSESAFVQLTINPLDPNDAANANRRGPDNPDDLVLDPNVRAFIDTLDDGRSTNRYFYRAAMVDSAHNLGPLGQSSPPIYLPKVFPPKTPVLTKIRGGERQIELRWVKTRESDLSAYRVYRTIEAANTRDIRLMERVQELPFANLDPNETEVIWLDKTVPAGIDFHYRVTALDSESLPNESAPSKVVIGRAVDTVPPIAPELISADWVLFDKTTSKDHPLSQIGSISELHVPVVKIIVKSDAAKVCIFRRSEADLTWRVMGFVTGKGNQPVVFLDREADPKLTALYRANATNDTNMVSPYSAILTVKPLSLGPSAVNEDKNNAK